MNKKNNDNKRILKNTKTKYGVFNGTNIGAETFSSDKDFKVKEYGDGEISITTDETQINDESIVNMNLEQISKSKNRKNSWVLKFIIYGIILSVMVALLVLLIMKETNMI